MTPLRIEIIGNAGQGIISTGNIIMESITKVGYFSSIYNNIPSLIQNGRTSVIITIASNQILCPVGLPDFVFLLEPLYIDSAIHLHKSGHIFLETKSQKLPENINFIDIPFSSFTSKFPGAVCLGIISKILALPDELVNDFINRQYTTNKNDSITAYKEVFHSSCLYAKNLQLASFPLIKQPTAENLSCLTGNDLISQGTIDAGCKFFASYPITPSTTIGNTLATLLPENGGISYQAEDEIAALGSVIGASFSGVKSMTATSGPGLSLMQEEIGYLSMVELPAVIVDVMRGGPSTGMPTRHEQSDLLCAVFGGHGDSPRIVLAPASIEDCYYIMLDAFNCSEQFTCPVIVLSDFALSFTKQTVFQINHTNLSIINRNYGNKPSEKYCTPFDRYSLNNTFDPVLPAPGKSNLCYRVTGLEHNENSLPDETPLNHEIQSSRRFSKLHNIFKFYSHLLEWDLEQPQHYNADFCLVSWGFSVLAVKEAIILLRAKNYKVAALYFKILYPICSDSLYQLSSYSSKIILPESNYSGQLSSLVKMSTSLQPISICNNSGIPFQPEELVLQIEKHIR